MKRDLDCNMFIFNLYPKPKDYLAQKQTSEHINRFELQKNTIENEQNVKNK